MNSDKYRYRNEIFDDEDDEDTQKDKYLTFEIAGEEYGVEVRCVIEVIGMQKITVVPDMPPFVKGVINLRGQVIPIMDVRSRFKLDFKEYDDRTCIVVVDMSNTFVGLVVDIVSDVLDISPENLSPAPKVNRTPGSRFIKGLGKVGDEVKIILDVQKLLYDEEMEKIRDIEEE
jgi:purine-binding chemotaxis protein CheW